MLPFDSGAMMNFFFNRVRAFADACRIHQHISCIVPAELFTEEGTVGKALLNTEVGHIAVVCTRKLMHEVVFSIIFLYNVLIGV